MRQLIVILLLLAAAPVQSQSDKLWEVEAESEDVRLDFLGDTVEIRTSAGLTLWWRRSECQGYTG